VHTLCTDRTLSDVIPGCAALDAPQPIPGIQRRSGANRNNASALLLCKGSFRNLMAVADPPTSQNATKTASSSGVQHKVTQLASLRRYRDFRRRPISECTPLWGPRRDPRRGTLIVPRERAILSETQRGDGLRVAGVGSRPIPLFWSGAPASGCPWGANVGTSPLAGRFFGI